MLSLLFPRCQLANQIFEDPSAVFVAVKLIKAGAGWSQQHYIARTGRFTRALDCGLERPDACDLSSLRLRLDLSGSRANGIDALHSLLEQRIQHTVVAALVLAAKNEVDAAGKRLQHFDGRVNVGGLRIVVILHPANTGQELQALL